MGRQSHFTGEVNCSEVKPLTRGHTASGWQNQDLEPDLSEFKAIALCLRSGQGFAEDCPDLGGHLEEEASETGSNRAAVFHWMVCQLGV